jgi:hypothetical protein
MMTDPITAEPDPVPDPAHGFPDVVAVPPPGAVPRESAIESAAMAAGLVRDQRRFLHALTAYLNGSVPVTADQVAAVADMRRRLAAVAGLIVRRRLSASAIIDAEHAQRFAERATALAVAAGQAAGALRSKTGPAGPDAPRVVDVVGTYDDGWRELGEVADTVFDTAVVAARVHGAPTLAAVRAVIATGGLTEAQEQRRDVVARLAGEGRTAKQIGMVVGLSETAVVELCRVHRIALPAAPVVLLPRDVTVELPPLIETLDRLGDFARRVQPGDVAAMDRDAAADAVRELWRVCTPLLGLRKMLDDHARRGQ